MHINSNIKSIAPKDYIFNNTFFCSTHIPFKLAKF